MNRHGSIYIYRTNLKISPSKFQHKAQKNWKIAWKMPFSSFLVSPPYRHTDTDTHTHTHKQNINQIGKFRTPPPGKPCLVKAGTQHTVPQQGKIGFQNKWKLKSVLKLNQSHVSGLVSVRRCQWLSYVLQSPQSFNNNVPSLTSQIWTTNGRNETNEPIF